MNYTKVSSERRRGFSAIICTGQVHHGSLSQKTEGCGRKSLCYDGLEEGISFASKIKLTILEKHDEQVKRKKRPNL